MNLERLQNESELEWQIRLCLAKKRHKLDADWIEIRDALGLDITPDELRKRAAGMLIYDECLHNDSNVAERILCISDAHVPFNLPANIFQDYACRVDTLIFNGDILDCYSCSSFPKLFKLGIDEELVAGRQYLLDVINLIRPKKVIIVTGNHEHRLRRHLVDRLTPDFCSIFTDNPLEFIVEYGFRVKDKINKTETHYSSLRDALADTEIEIEFDGGWYIKEGNVLFVHPLAYSAGMLKTTEKAINSFLRLDRTFTGLVMAHTHKIGSFVQGGIKMYEQGCVCDLSRLDYADGKLQLPNQNGFMYICLDNDGNIIDSKTKLVTID